MNMKALRNAKDIEFQCNTCRRAMTVARVDVFVGLDVPRVNIEPCRYCHEKAVTDTIEQVNNQFGGQG